MKENLKNKNIGLKMKDLITFSHIFIEENGSRVI